MKLQFDTLRKNVKYDILCTSIFTKKGIIEMTVDQKAENNPCVINLTVKAGADEIKGEAKKVLNEFMREAQVPGFRKGKVPVEIIRKNFAAELKRETEGACFRAFYPKAVEQSELKVIALAGVTEMKLDEATGMEFNAIVEIRPEYKLPKYKGLSIKKGEAKVEDAAVESQLESMRKMFAKYDDGKEGDVAAEGDFVQFDYAGSIDDQPLSEIVPDQKAICEGKGFWAQIDEGRFLPEILEALKGMKAGDEKKNVKVKFPKDAAPEAIKGKKAVYEIKLTMIRKCTLPDDAGLVEAMKSESIEKIRADIRERLEKQAAEMEVEKRRNQVIDHLLKKAEFDVPPSLVQRQTEAYLGRLAQQMQYAGVTNEYIEQNREKILKEATEQAEKQVRLSYLLLDIADVEKIEVDEKDEDKKDQIRAEKTLDMILAEAKK
jgi:trigger factor